ncbi:MAG TPA: alpha/beta hydrolase, partial [Rubellimicrobium sp.]|nr:alpha/beta hydrolase [Rubellimicrobium sp.]
MAEVNGISMYYATFGAGDPVLLIHGGMVNSDHWSAQVTDLMKDHLVIVADSRGHGRSSHDERPVSYDLMAEDYIALLDFLKIPKVDIVGSSDGGIIGLDIAMHHPERLDDLFAQGANVTPDGVISSGPPPEDFILWTTADYARKSPTPDGFEDLIGEMSALYEREPNWSDEALATITAPVTLALGDHDADVSRAHTDHMAAVIPGAKEVILP